MSTYSTNLKIEEIGTGEQSGAWGTTTNSNFQNVFEQAIVGRVTVPFTDADVTLTATNSVSSQSFRNLYLNCTGTNTGIKNLIVPTINKNYVVQNNTTGGYSIVVKTSGGTGITVPTGKTCIVYADGTNVIQAFDYLPVATVGTLAITSVTANSITAGSITDSGLTAGRLTYAGTAGLLQDDADLTFDGTTLTAAKVSSTQVDITAQGDLRLQDTTGGEYVALQAPATLASSYTLTMPVDDGTNGQALITDGSGNLSWSTAASGDVYGPASATDNAIARFDSTTGKIIQNSLGILSDAGALSGLTGLSSTSITDSGLTATRVTYATTGGLLTDSANLTFDGTYLIVNSIKDSALTSGRVVYAGASGLLSDSSVFTFDGTTVSATKFAGAFNGTLGATTPSTVAATSGTFSTTLGVTGTATFTAKPIVDTLSASQAVFSDGSKGLVSNPITGTGNVVMSASPTLTGTAAFSALTASADSAFNGTGAIQIPVGTTGQQPTGASGKLRFNSTTSSFEGYNGTTWGSIGGGATGGGGDQVFVQNQMIVTTTYAIPSGYSAESVGPITFNSGVSVTVPAGSRWVVL